MISSAMQTLKQNPSESSPTPPTHSQSSGSAPAKLPTAIAFVSGPLEADWIYFNTYYAPRIKESASEGHLFIVGASRGIDTLAFAYLRNLGVSASRVRLYLDAIQAKNTRLRERFTKFEEVGGKVIVIQGGHTERDEAMTRASHYDVLRYRTEEECRALYGAKYRKRISGTEKNEMRRKTGIGLVLLGADE